MIRKSCEKAIILVDHGSRLEEANAMLERVAERLQAQLPDYFVQAAHMELAEPSIEQAFTLCVKQGAREITVFPYFLSPGRHSQRDIPALCAAAARKHPQVTYRLTEAFGLHEKILDIIRDRTGLNG